MEPTPDHHAPLIIPADPIHAEELFSAIERNRAHLRQWLAWAHEKQDLPSTRRFLEQRAQENRDRTAFTAIIRVNGALCGSISLHRIDTRNRSSSIGYWVDQHHQGQGIVTRACRAILHLAFTEYGLHRVEIRCATGNHRSCSIPERLGFREEGTLREAEWLYDHYVDLRVFSILAIDPR